MDLGLLGHSELHTACELHKRFPGVNIIVLSEYNEPEIVDQVMAAGASAFVLKQYAGSDLYDAIESVQKEHTYVSPSIQKKNKAQQE